MAVYKCMPIPPLSGEFIKHFWERVDVQDAAKCWRWKAGLDDNGYGRVGIDYKIFFTHRVAYFLSYKEDPVSLCVLHRCIASPACCNPLHLYLGTDMENARDRKEQGRQVPRPFDRGEKHHLAKLTDAKVREIRTLRAEGVMTKELAARYGVNRTVIQKVVRHEMWRHVE